MLSQRRAGVRLHIIGAKKVNLHTNRFCVFANIFTDQRGARIAHGSARGCRAQAMGAHVHWDVLTYRGHAWHPSRWLAITLSVVWVTVLWGVLAAKIAMDGFS